MPKDVRDLSTIWGKTKLLNVYLYCLHFVTLLTTLVLVWMVEFSCWLISVKLCVLYCWLSWPLILVTQSGGRKLTYIMMVPIC